MKKPKITPGSWFTKGSLICSDKYGLVADSEIYELRDIEHCKVNAKAISQVPNMIDELIEDYKAYKHMFEITKESAIQDYCHDRMEYLEIVLKDAGCS